VDIKASLMHGVAPHATASVVACTDFQNLLLLDTFRPKFGWPAVQQVWLASSTTPPMQLAGNAIGWQCNWLAMQLAGNAIGWQCNWLASSTTPPMQPQHAMLQLIHAHFKHSACGHSSLLLLLCVCVLALQFCHAFVGYLEEEAVKTYTQALQVRRLSASGPYLNMRSGLIGWIVLNFSD
jgi:hypothetical protein